MESIAKMVGQQMKWQQPSLFKMEYQLMSVSTLAADTPPGDALVGILRFRSSWGTLATAECADGCWTFKRVGFWQTRVTIRACNAESDLASFKNNTWKGGGTLELQDGRIFRANTNFWMTKYSFQTEQGDDLVNFRQISGFRLSGVVEIQPAAQGITELPMMVMLGWYLIIMMHNDAAAASAAAAT